MDPLEWIALEVAREFVGKQPTVEDVLRYSAVAFKAGQHRVDVTTPASKGSLSSEQKSAHWKAIDTTARKWEPVFLKSARKAFESDMRAILAIVSEVKTKALRTKATIDWRAGIKSVSDYLQQQSKETWRKTFVPSIQGVITDQAERWASELGMQFSVRNFFAEAWFGRYTMQFSQPIIETTLDTMSKVFEQAMQEGWSIETMQSNLQDMFQQWMNGDVPLDEFTWYAERMPNYRAEAIARTETMRASNAGTQELFTEWGVKKKEWISTKDNRTRTAPESEFDHIAADGEVVAMNEPFVLTGEELMYPGDPNGSPGNTINCRCATLPVVEDKSLKYDPDQPRDELGRFGSGGVGSEEVSFSAEGDELTAAQELGLPTTYSGTQSRGERFSGKSVDNPIPRSTTVDYSEIESIIKEHGGNYETVDVPLSDLTSPQDYVRPTAVKEFKDKIEDGSFYKSKPIVATIKGERVILNGTHTILAAQLAGRTEWTVRDLGTISLED